MSIRRTRFARLAAEHTAPRLPRDTRLERRRGGAMLARGVRQTAAVLPPGGNSGPHESRDGVGGFFDLYVCLVAARARGIEDAVLEMIVEKTDGDDL